MKRLLTNPDLPHFLFLGLCFTVPLSIVCAQLFFYGLALLFLLILIGPSSLTTAARSSLSRNSDLFLPFASWWWACLISCFVGIAPLRSLISTAHLAATIALPFSAYFFLSLKPAEVIPRLRLYIATLSVGQLLAATYTFCEKIFSISLPVHPPGPVTQGGQLLLVGSALLGTVLFSWFAKEGGFAQQTKGRFVLSTLLLFIFFLLLAWPQALLGQCQASTCVAIQVLSVVALLATLCFLPKTAVNEHACLSMTCWYPRMLYRGFFTVRFLTFATSMLAATFLLVLKRGPWFGAFIAALISGSLLFSRRAILFALVGGATVLLAVAPARERMLQLPDHFAISGGRQTMWLLGLDLLERFPLGLGTHNATFMREVDPTLPEAHRHMHNNLLNVAVEGGWLSLACYLWFLYALVRMGLMTWSGARHAGAMDTAAFALLLLAGLIGWQVAGLVEYNFGDGEIRYIALFLIGALLAIRGGLSPNEQVA